MNRFQGNSGTQIRRELGVFGEVDPLIPLQSIILVRFIVEKGPWFVSGLFHCQTFLRLGILLHLTFPGSLPVVRLPIRLDQVLGGRPSVSSLSFEGRLKTGKLTLPARLKQIPTIGPPVGLIV